MTTSSAHVDTASASRYLQQLCKHWTHKFTVDFDAERGHIDFGDGRDVTLSATANRLSVQVRVDQADQLPVMEDVVERHIKRFAFREDLIFAWNRDDA